MIPELKTLVAVARFGTFAAAGDRIGLTQAAVSGHMRRLEEKLGFELFERTGRSASLNAAGLRTLARAQEIIALVDALGDPVRDGELQGKLKIGAISSAQSTVLARALPPFRDRFAAYHVHIIPGISLHLLDQLDAGELDLAILIRPSFGIPPELVWRPLVREPYALVVPAGLEQDDWRDALREQPFLRYERGSFGGRQVDRFLRSLSIPVREWIEIDDIPAMLSMVGQGLGVSLLPMAEANLPLPESLRALPLGEDSFHREIGLLHRRQEDPATGYLAQCLVEAGAQALSRLTPLLPCDTADRQESPPTDYL